jgi:pimeloyl-ACP methyl ester carboxylesterase
VSYVAVDGGIHVRYIAAGSGPALLLLHTLRTQLDMFQKVIPELAQRFRVYALDYPGHGYSDTPDADYADEFFVAAVAGVLDRLDIVDATIVGESIGGTIALLLAARRHPRVSRVVAINPYDYDRGRGLRRSSPLANLVFAMYDVPLLGAMFWRLRPPYAVVKRILEGGVYRKDSFPAALERELYVVGAEPGHARAFRRLVEHWPSWEQARAEYGHIAAPVLLLYGDHDWSHEDEREADRRAIPGASLQVVEHAGHFLALDAPEALVRAVVEFASGRAA